MKGMVFVLCAAIGLPASAAEARDRSGERPPVIVSPDLSAPWVMQVRRTPVDEKRAFPPSRVRRAAMNLPPLLDLDEARPHPQRASRPIQAGVITLPRAREPSREIDPIYLPQDVSYDGPEEPGTIIIDTRENFLYLVEAAGTARRYGVGTGKPGFEWAGSHRITQKREWPDWRPPAEMISRERRKGRVLPVHMAGGPENPLGARALYLGSTLYRIHGTNQPWTIGAAVSSGCIRMRNEDVVDLYDRVAVGTKVVVM